MPPLKVVAGQVQSFTDLFVDERSHFYARRRGQLEFIHQDRPLANEHIQQHLEGRSWVAVTRAEATRVLSVDLDCMAGPDPVWAMFKRYDTSRSVMLGRIGSAFDPCEVRG